MHSGPVQVQFEVLLRLDANQTEKSAIRKGGRPSMLSIEEYVVPEDLKVELSNEELDGPEDSMVAPEVPIKKSFPAGRDDENIVMFVQDFNSDKSVTSRSLKVKALYDEGTTPVLAVSLEKVTDKSSKTSGASEGTGQ